MPNYFGPDGTGAGNDTGPAMDDPRDAELARLRAQLAEAEAERDRLSAAIMPKGCPKFAEGIDPVVMLDEERKVWRDEIDAISTALAASESKRKVLADALRMCEFGETVGVDGPGFCPVCCGRGRHSADGCVVADALSASGVEVLARGFCPPNPDSGVAVIIRPAPVTAEWTPCLIIRTDAANALEGE